jgi:hypothetical protein
MRMQRARKSRGALREGVHYDEAAAARERAEIVARVRQILSSSLDLPSITDAAALVDHFVIVTPPEAAGIEITDAKPGTIELNLGRLVNAVIDHALTFTGATLPWTMLHGALAVWERLWLGQAEVTASETDAAVLWALWTTRDGRDMVSKSTITTAVHGLLTKHGRPTLTPVQIDAALLKLRRLKCIETARSAANSFWLREVAQMRYP